MFKQLGAVRTNDTECLYVRCFAADICDDTDLRQQSVFLFFASTTTIAHLLGTSHAFDDFYDIQRLRAFLYAASASDAGIHSIVVIREVNQLVHETLTETLHLCGTVVSCCHHRKVRVHTGIPAAVTLYTVSCIEILDIIALAGRTGERTGSAA